MEVEERIKELEAGLVEAQKQLQESQEKTQRIMQTMIATNGGLTELKKLQEDLNTSKEPKK